MMEMGQVQSFAKQQGGNGRLEDKREKAGLSGPFQE